MSLDQSFAGAMGQLIGPDFPSELALAVSGGSDSMAMLYLAHNWTRVWGVKLRVFTVDHGFRPEAADEAAMVGREAAALGWPHLVLPWHWDGRGNKMEAAREARIDLIGRHIAPGGHILMAHTLDDVAETFLMRMKRGSGVDGLSAMAPRRWVQGAGSGCWVLRPCLGMRRADLQHYLRVLKGPWVDDPSNEDLAFDRARMRAALPELDRLGLSVDRLAATAQAQARAREALRARAVSVWREIGREGAISGLPSGDLLLDRDGFARIERDTQLRILAAALCFVSSAPRRPRLEALEAALEKVLAGGSTALHGCELIAEREDIRLIRELSAVKPMRDALWDGRWRLRDQGARPADRGLICALGDTGWQSLPAELRAGVPYKVGRVLPMVADPAGAAVTSVLQDARGFEYCPLGQPGLTFDAFLASH